MWAYAIDKLGPPEVIKKIEMPEKPRDIRTNLINYAAGIVA